MKVFRVGVLLATLFCMCATAFAQPAPDDQTKAIQTKLAELQAVVAKLHKTDAAYFLIADVEVYAKAAEWILRHSEFYQPAYAQHALAALDTGLARGAELLKKNAPWQQQTGKTIRGYQSAVDESVQPYAVTLPPGLDNNSPKRWPLHLVLHGRGANLNEVSFIRSHDNKPPQPEQDWIQLDVFGRTNNAYRFSGESDVFEALADVTKRFRIDEKRIVLHGFSMGGAGSWHLGMHHPSRWCSVGPGAGFTDFYKYQKVTTPLPFYQDAVLHIYDSVDYALNAFNVPVCTYGGELDPQLAAGKNMVEAAEKLGVQIKLLIGPGTEHKFHPDSLKEFMAFHRANQERGRPGYPAPDKLRFITWTLKYNKCAWLTIEEMTEQYRPAIVESERDEKTGLLKIKTQNVSVLELGRDLGEHVEIDGVKLTLGSAADNLLPGVYFEGGKGNWQTLSYDASLNFQKNLDLRKRHDLQGPIDDAFMGPFVCVRGTGTPWSAEHAAWANWTLDRFTAEFDKWLRGKVPSVKDSDISTELIADKNLILFGDPGSNSVLANIIARLPIKWTKDSLEVNGVKYDPAAHGVVLIYPNPLNPRRYVVINSGHTFHERDFKASNAWLFPKLGDIAVLKFEKTASGGYGETTAWADFFDLNWKLPSGLASK